MENPQMNPLPHDPQMPHAEKSQAGTNLAIVVLILVIVVVGIKLFMSSASKEAGTAGLEATSTEATSTKANMPAEATSTNAITAIEQGASAITSLIPEGKGETVFSVVSVRAIVVREIYVHNPYRSDDPNKEWVLVYDGYKLIPAGETVQIFKVFLAPLVYDKVRVRTLSVETGAPEEIVKDMAITITAKTSTPITISL